MKKKNIVIVIGLLLTITIFFASSSNLIFASSNATINKNKNYTKPISGLERMKSFDPSKAEDLRNDKGFNSKYKNGILQNLNLSKNTPLESKSFANHDMWGADIIQKYYLNTPRVMGVYARHFIDDSLTLGDDEYRELFAPTLKGPEPCPLEAVTVYIGFTSGITSRYFGIYDHSIPAWTGYSWSFQEMRNEDWIDESGGMEYYETVIWYDSSESEWNLYLWDFEADVADLVYSQEDDENTLGGWDSYEGYYDTTWPETEYLRASEILDYVYTNGYGWNWLYNSFPFGGTIDKWPGFSLEHGFYNNYYEWYVGE